jgi:hypothetical protein
MDFRDNLENFIRHEITWIHVQSMTDAQKVHLDKLVKDGKASTTQEEWHRYLHYLPPNPGDDYYENNYYTDRNGNKFVYRAKDYVGDENKEKNEIGFKVNLSDNDWKEFYKYFRDNFRAMDKNRDNLDGVFAKPYLNKWFGEDAKEGKVFWKASPNYSKDSTDNMEALGNILSQEGRDSNGEKIDKLQMLFNLARTYQGAFTPKNKNSFIYYLQNPKLADTDFFNDVQELFSRIGQNAQYDVGGQFSAKIPGFLKNNSSFDFMDAVDKINNGVIDDEVSFSQVESIKQFYPDLMFNLYDKEKRQQAFTHNGYPGIVSIINNVKEKNDYKEDAFNKIVPKENDKRTNLQYVEKVWSDYREGTWDKLGNRHRRHSYSSQSGKELVDAIYKCKIKPADGLEKILADKDKIKAEFYITNPKAIPQFNWIFTILDDVKKTMPKAFADALRDGQKMHHIVEYIIQRAAREDKLEHARSFLEMLNVMQYGPFASDVRGKLFGKDVNWTFFGDLPSLKGSEALSFMAKATDRVIKFGARAAFELMNYGWRRFQRRGLKFHVKGPKKFMDQLDAWYDDIMLDPDMTPEKLNQQIEKEKTELENLNTEIADKEAERQAIINSFPPELRNTFDTEKKQFDDENTNLENAAHLRDEADKKRSEISAQIVALGLPRDLKPMAAESKINHLNQEIEKLETAGKPVPDAKYDEIEKYSQWIQLTEAMDAENGDFEKCESQYNGIATSPGYKKRKAFFDRPDFDRLKTIEKELNEKKERHDELEFHIPAMKNRVRDLEKNAAKDTPKKIEKDGEEKDATSVSKYEKIADELAIYWDFQISGLSDNINPFRHQKKINDKFKEASDELAGKSQYDVLMAKFQQQYRDE